MLFNSWQYLLFYPVVVLLYFIAPKRFKNWCLLIASYYFYMGWNPKYVFLLLFATVATYAGSLVLEKKRRTWVLVLVIFAILAMLCYFKYANFTWHNVYLLCSKLNIPFADRKFDIVLPVGISFFTFQAMGYLIDVYRGDIYAEKNFFRYALFVSFFPQLVAGPIERSKNLLKQLDKTYSFDFDNFREGLLMMMWGFFMKIVIADRAAMFVDKVFNDLAKYSIVYIAVATVFFAFQIYCDFSGYSLIAMGSAKVIGLNIMENFNAPYFSQSVAEFWRRWHISLSTWFRDYLYFPLGGSRCSTLRRYFNLMVVFLVSGLWHGANWTFVVWGGLNGLFQVIGLLSKDIRSKLLEKICINSESFSHRLLKTVVTFVLVDFAWFFFRANNLADFNILLKKASDPTMKNLFGNLGNLHKCGMDGANFCLLILCIMVLMLADWAKARGICVRKNILKQDYWFRWLVFAGRLLFILIFGIRGPKYDAKSFIYFQF